MRKPNYTLRRIVAGLIVAAIVYLITAYVWFTGSGYCIGSMVECVKL